MWPYYLLLFVASGCIMTLELVAGRLAAPYIGVSLYTWTGVIGAVLAGMSFGSIIGGWLSDRTDPRRLLGWMLIVSGILAAAVIPFTPLVMGKLVPRSWPPLIGIFLPSLLLFGIPTFFMAAISPVVYKIALRDMERLGGTVGRLSASGIIGSLVGTYATGFYLIPTFGTRSIVLGVAVILALLGILAMPWRRLQVIATAVVLLVGLPYGRAMAAYPQYFNTFCTTESAYYCIRITYSGGDPGTPGSVKQLVLDHLVHAGFRLGEPDVLWYDYEKVMAWVLRAWGRQDLATLSLGGGGYLLPYWIEKHFPEATVEVAEIDPAVTRVALQEFVPESRRIVTYNMDARQALLGLPEGKKYDVLFGDAFNDVSVPYHLTTVEFGRLLRRHMADESMYLLNVIDRQNGPFLGAYATTMAQVFPYVYVLPGDSAAQHLNHSTYIIVASTFEIPWDDWRRQVAPPFPLPVLPLEGKHMVLTDDHAPVDQLLLPVFHDRWRRYR